MKKRENNTAQSSRSMQGAFNKPNAAHDVGYFSLYCYLWDVIDEGLSSFPRLAEQLGLTNISVAASYHGGKALLPHNSKRHVYFIEDGAVYFRPKSRLFTKTRMRPLISRLVKQRDYFHDLVDKCQRRGVKTTAWTVALHNTYLGTNYPEFTTKNVFGDHYLHALCPSQPSVIAYLSALVRSLASYDIDAVEFETFEHVSFRHYAFLEKEGVAITPMAGLLLSLCFCTACQTMAQKQRIAMRPLMKGVKKWLQDYFAGENRSTAPVDQHLHEITGLTEYLEARFDVLADAFAEVSGTLHESGKRVIFLSIGQQEEKDYLSGVDLKRLAQHADAVETLFYARRPDEAHDVVTTLRRALTIDRPIYCAIRPGYPDARSLDDVTALTNSVLRAGAAGVSYYNFGLLEKTRMPWIRNAIQETRQRSAKSSQAAERYEAESIADEGFVRPNVLRKAF